MSICVPLLYYEHGLIFLHAQVVAMMQPWSYEDIKFAQAFCLLNHFF